MPSQKNINQLNDLKDKIKKSKSVVFSDYRGLTVSQATDLRQMVKQVGAELKVSKNTLIYLALNKKIEFQQSLEGPTIILFSYDDEISALKVLHQFFQANELPGMKAGLLGDQFLSGERLIELAQLPGKSELQTKLVATLNAPLYGLVYSLKTNLTKLILILKQIKPTKS